MRPRPDAAENGLLRPGHLHRRLPVASMRPRPDAAENATEGQEITTEQAASMRPRPDAAENMQEWLGERVVRGLASMRPRPDAAENMVLPAWYLRAGSPLQ